MSQSTLEQTFVDPVCGMAVEKDVDLTCEHEGKTYYFCCAGCKEKFEENPGVHTARQA